MKLYMLTMVPMLVYANLSFAITPDDKANEFQQKVHLSDLDLSNDADIAILKSRVRSAAKSVCKNIDEASDRECSLDAEMVANRKVALIVERHRKLYAETNNPIFAHNERQSQKCK